MKYKSEIYKAVHMDASAMFEVGAIPAEEMREFDRKCLVLDTEAPSAGGDYPLGTSSAFGGGWVAESH